MNYGILPALQFFPANFRRTNQVNIKIVTDSTSDLPQALVDQLGITIVPVYVLFGNKIYRDRFDISGDEFYEQLISSPIHPTTSQPSPQDFVNAYTELAKDADAILSVHISNKLSGTYNSAIQAKEMVSTGCPIEVIDSFNVSMGLGLMALKAAEMAKAGSNLEQIAAEVRQMVGKTHVWAMFDTLKYLAKGGRVGKAKALMGSVLNIKPVLAVKDGEMVPASKARSRDKGIDMLVDYAARFSKIDDMSVIYTTTPDEAEALADQLGAKFERSRIKISRLGPALGVHAGPGTVGVAVTGTL